MEQERPLLCENCQTRISNAPHALPSIDLSLLRSNHIPSEAEISRNIKFLQEETRELQQYKRDIAYLRRTLEQMEARKNDLESHRERRRCFLSVQRKVPFEIWEEIFAIVCFSNSTDRCSLTIQQYEGKVRAIPITLSHVCSRWREIVNRSPTLWASISVHFHGRSSERITNTLETFLTNSGSSPLNLRLSFDCGMERSHASWKLVKRHISRSSRLFVDFIGVGTDGTFREPDITFHNLVSFHCGFNPCVDPNGKVVKDVPLWRALSRAPKLTEVQLCNLSPLRSLPYHQITTLVIDYLHFVRVKYFLSVLGHMGELRILKLGSFSGEPVDLNIRHVEIPYLHTLSICPALYEKKRSKVVKIYNEILGYLLASFVMPSLSTFELACYSVRVWPSSLLSMLQRSSITIRHFSLALKPQREGFSTFSWGSLSVLVNKVPHITHLSLSGSNSCWPDITPSLCWGNSFAPFLTELADVSGNSSPILPHLSHICIVHIGNVTPDIVNTVLTVATARSPNRLLQSSVDSNDVDPLEELRVEDWESPEIVLEPRLVKEMQDLKQDGVKVLVERPDWWYDQ